MVVDAGSLRGGTGIGPRMAALGVWERFTNTSMRLPPLQLCVWALLLAAPGTHATVWTEAEDFVRPRRRNDRCRATALGSFQDPTVGNTYYTSF